MTKLLKLLKQKTTWAGFISAATALGATVSPDLAAEITTAGMSLVGILLILFDEDKHENAE